MNKHQIKWAREHDWFREELPKGVRVYDSSTNSLMTFISYSALRMWAGY